MKFLRKIFNRMTIVALLILIQIATVVVMFTLFNEYFVYFYAFFGLISVFCVLYVANSNTNPAYKIAWIIPILAIPMFGTILYLLFGNQRTTKKSLRKAELIQIKYKKTLDKTDPIILDDDNAQIQSNYISNTSGFPLCRNTSAQFLASGEEYFDVLLGELKKAKTYIFLEYFIIAQGKLWNAILEVLKQKVAEGVEVRLIYDDFGCMQTLPNRYDKKLKALGIQCIIFNKFRAVLSSKFNNRDHRKICVIDGMVAFTGGVNIADEYINEEVRFGHWKDSGIILRGEGVKSFAVMFLTTWDFIVNEVEEYEKYYPPASELQIICSNGYVQPFCDSPRDTEVLGESVYKNLIGRAKKYIYITTPYLIIGSELLTALTTAAKSGVDIRIMTPHIPDKKIVFSITRSYYENLISAGIQIFEYTPGFLHSKTFVCDDEYAVVGTFNFDFRSLYLHYECAVWLYNCETIMDIKKDFENTQEVCENITLLKCKAYRWNKGILRGTLRLFAPLL